MQAISTALSQVLETGSWFVRAREIKLWVVRVSADIRRTALRVVAGLEFLQDNRSAWVVLPDAHTATDPGWQVRANRLIAHWSERRKAFLEEEGIEMPEAQVIEARAKKSSWFREALPISPMRGACEAVIAALRPPLDGIVIVAVPAVLTNPNAMGAEIEALANDPALADCRWVWVLDANQPVPEVIDRMGKLGLHCECIPDPGQQKKDLAAMMDAPPKTIGRAGPRGVTAPRRINEPPHMPPEELAAALRAAGVSPEYCERAPELQHLILGAAVAMKNGDSAGGVQQQQAAGELSLELRIFDVAVLCRIALGSYLTAAGRRDEALLALKGAAALARQHSFALQESQAHLGIGLLLCLAKRYLDSAEAYGTSARCAETAKVPVLAIESWRMAGQVSLQARDLEMASFAFREAFRVAEESDVDTVKGSTAPESARKLAEIYDRLRMPAQAESLRAEAEAMERGEIGINNPVPAEI